MAASVHCDIVNEQGEVFSGLVEAIKAPGMLGTLGIYPGHSALITDLACGTLCLTKSGGEQQSFPIAGGFLEVQPNWVKVLTYSAESGTKH